MIDLTKYGAKFIPLVRNGKTPTGRFKGVDFTPTELKQHVARQGNLGLLAQPNFVFIDIDRGDNHGGVNGVQNFSDWLAEHGMDLETLMDQALVQVTPTMGLHLIFLQPEQPKRLSYTQSGPNVGRFSQDIGIIDGVDIKASTNNYILVQPSQIDGKPYKFLHEHEPIPMPTQLAIALHEEEAKARSTKGNQAKQIAVEGTPDERGLVYRKNGRFPQLDVFYTIANGFGSKGHRNDAVFEWTKAMRRITDEKTAIEYAKIANQHSDSPLPMREIVATIKSAYNYQTSLTSMDASGHTWVVLKSRISQDSTSILAVLQGTYVKNGSPYYQDYEPGLLYSAARVDQDAPATIKPTIWNYQEGGADDGSRDF